MNPGIVLISFIYISPVDSSMKKSILDNPVPSIAVNNCLAYFLIKSDCSFEIFAGTLVFELLFSYFEENE